MSSHNTKKRKRNVVVHNSSGSNGVETSKPTAVFEPTGGRKHTLSIALPGSIIANAQSHDLKTALAGQIARAATVFCVDEIVVFDDGQSHKQKPSYYQRPPLRQHYDDYGEEYGEDAYTGYSDPNHFLYHLLSYLETPAHLRKFLFPRHPNLRTAGTLPSLDMPHHIRRDEWCQYREGVTVEASGAATTSGGADEDADAERRTDKQSKKKKRKRSDVNGDANTDHTIASQTTLVEAGLPSPVHFPNITIPPRTRVTLKFPSATAPPNWRDPHPTKPLTAEAVSPDAPREEAGYYWGYQVRQCGSLSAAFTECTYDGGYDFCVGTSERGEPLASVLTPSAAIKPLAGAKADAGSDASSSGTGLPQRFSHMLLVFGGVAGLEAAVAADQDLKAKGIGKENVSELFDCWVNLVSGQGSRTIRTEEAVWLGLMGWREFVRTHGC